MAPRKSPLKRKEMREAVEPKEPPKMADDEAAIEGTPAQYEARRIRKMKRA